MADNKPERKKSPLYDRGSDKDVRAPEKGKPKEEAHKEAEPKGKGGDGVRAKEGGKPHDKDAGAMHEPGKGGEGGTRAPEAGDVHERHAEERAAMHKSHETERRDLHGNHREEHRKMAARHEKAHKDLADKHMAELSAASGPTDGLKEGGEAALGGQTAAAGGEPTVQATA